MGKIKTVGNATMEFEADYYEFHVIVSLIDMTSGDAISKGRSRTERILQLLQDNLGFEIKNFTLKNEKNKAMHDRKDGYKFEKEFYFRYEANNHITESVVALLENISDVEYSIDFKLNNKSEKEQLVMSLALNNSKEKAEKLVTALGSRITGFEAIDYRFSDTIDEDGLCEIFRGLKDNCNSKNLASDLKNPKIKISKSVEIIWTTDGI